MTDEAARALEALSDIQERSLQAAGALVERLVAVVDGASRDVADGPVIDGDIDGDAAVPNPLDELIDGWAKLWRDSIAGLVDGTPSSRGTAARLEAGRASVAPPLVAVLDVNGRAELEVWVHNPTGEQLDKLRLHCGAPRAHDGASIDPLALTFEPDVFDLPPRSSRGVAISVDAPDAPTASYRTLLLVDGLADQWLPLEIRVEEPAS